VGFVGASKAGYRKTLAIDKVIQRTQADGWHVPARPDLIVDRCLTRRTRRAIISTEVDFPVIRWQESAMSAVIPDASPGMWTIADVHARLPGYPDDRIRIKPLPGTATEQDVLEAEARTGRICELIDGTLVEKTRKDMK
jgi:hypothetical protein